MPISIKRDVAEMVSIEEGVESRKIDLEMMDEMMIVPGY
jgi:hypothetical protein